MIAITERTSVDKEILPKYTKEEFTLWFNSFKDGMHLFDMLVGNFDFVSTHICPTHGGIKRKVAFIEDQNIMVVTFAVIEDSISYMKKYFTGKRNLRQTNAHLTRLRLCTSPDVMPIFTGIEEKAHAYFFRHVKPYLDPNLVVYTGKYDGSDASEAFAFASLCQIILQNKDLPLYPLPSNL